MIANDSYNSTTLFSNMVLAQLFSKKEKRTNAQNSVKSLFATCQNPKNATATLAATPYREAAVTGTNAHCSLTYTYPENEFPHKFRRDSMRPNAHMVLS